jgi:tetratricopeptide (TPR) repeat protein
MQFRLLGEILTYTQLNFAYAQQNFNLSNEMLPLVVELSKNVDEINRKLPSNYSAKTEDDWKPIFKEFESAIKDLKEIREIVERIDERGEKHYELSQKQSELLNEILESIKSDKASKPLKTTFYPKNFPDRLIYFTGRENVLERIAEALQTKGKAALADTHGVGKSSVIIEFAHRNKDSFKHILFIRATANEFNTFVSEIVNELGFSLPNDAPPQVRLETLQKWLAENEDWLLLIDNVDDVGFIKDCNFNKPTGKVIYTSNDDKIYRVGTAVDIPRMSDENAMLLLYKHWQDKAEAEFTDIPEKYHSTLKQIAEDFGNHPFSMAFVGSYLADEDESLEEFLKAYHQKEKNLLANYEFLSNYQHKSVATAFLLRFEQISTPKDKSEREKFLSIAVQDYLKFSAFIATDNIPEEFLQQSLTKLHPEQTELINDGEFIKEIYKRFKPTSIFKRNGEDKTLNTHRIVQEIMRFQINVEEDLILSVIANTLADNFEWFDFANKEKVERYLSHIGIFLKYLEENKSDETKILRIDNKSTANLCNNYARYFDQYGEYKKAEKYYEYFKDICERVEEIDETWQATSYNNLAGLYESQGKYEEAEPYYLKALAIREKVLGEHHPDTAGSYNNLAGLYESQGKYEEAEPYYLKALAICEKVLGEEHPDTATSYNNLAGLYKSQGKYEEAETYHLKALAIREKVLGEEHPDTATSYNNLALLYNLQKRYEEAETYHLKALAIREKALGEDHHYTATSYNNLALLYKSQGKYNVAESYYLKALVINEKVLGEEHPDTALSYYNLGVFYAEQGKLEEAKEYIETGLPIWMTKLGESHPYTLRAKLSLQNVIIAMQNSEK